LEVVVEDHRAARMLTVGPLFMALWPAEITVIPLFPLSENRWHR